MIVYGINPVKDLLEYVPSLVEEIYFVKGLQNNRLREISSLAEKNGTKLSGLNKTELERITNSSKHQGVAAEIKEFEYSGLNEILKNGSGFFLILDHIEDPQNLGAIIRTANFFGVGGIVIPRDRAVGITPAVIKSSSGAVMTMPVCRVSNISNAISEFKKKNLWIVGADSSSGKTLEQTDLKGLDIALVIGSESRGLGKRIKEQCDFLVTIPRSGNVESLNASVAAAILIYELKKRL